MKTKEITIKGRVYKCAPFQFTEATEIMWEIGNVLGPSLGEITGAFKSLNKDDILTSAIDGKALGEAIQGVFTRLPPGDVIPLMTKLFRNVSTTVKNAKGGDTAITFVTEPIYAMNLTFSGEHMTDGYELIPFVLGVNFPPLAQMGAQLSGTLSGVISGITGQN